MLDTQIDKLNVVINALRRKFLRRCEKKEVRKTLGESEESLSFKAGSFKTEHKRSHSSHVVRVASFNK